jgi:ribosomal-protein-alanine N-acetyltransferase
MTIATRLLTAGDAPILAGLLAANREFLAPWEPVREDSYFTADGQRGTIGTVLDQHERGITVPHAIVDGDRVVGRITLNNVVRGPFLTTIRTRCWPGPPACEGPGRRVRQVVVKV